MPDYKGILDYRHSNSGLEWGCQFHCIIIIDPNVSSQLMISTYMEKCSRRYNLCVACGGTIMLE